MRRKPVTRDEIRLSERGTILTIPADSVRFSARRLGDRYIPIDRLWNPLFEALQKEQDDIYAFHKSGPFRSWPFERRIIHWPRIWSISIKKTCKHCGRGFFNSGRWRSYHCSDKCVRAARRAPVVKARSEERAAERAGLKCQTCGTKLAAKRSTAKFCSVRCRVAAHRV
jgi:hypothetical protein